MKWPQELFRCVLEHEAFAGEGDAFQDVGCEAEAGCRVFEEEDGGF
jgi:hypothetical protein